MITSVRQAFEILRSRWRFFTAVLVAGLLWSLYLLWSTAPSYQSSATLFVSTPPSSGISNMSVAAMVTQERVRSYADLATDSKVLGAAAERLPGMSESDLQDRVSAQAEENTLLLVVEALGDTPEEAKQVNTVVVEEIIRVIGEMEEPGDGDVELPFIVNVASDPSLGTDPVEPKIPMGLGIGFAVSLLVAAAATLIRQGLDSTVRTSKEIAVLAAAPCFAVLPTDGRAARELTASAPASPFSEAIRVLRSNLQFMELDGPQRTVLITSAVEGAGRTTIALELAVSFARADKSVLLIDLDLRRSTLAARLQLSNDGGLVSLLVGTSDLGSEVQRHASGVDVLVGGPTPPNPAELVHSDAMRALLAEVGHRYDMVVIDGLAVLPTADAAAIAHDVDGVLLVVDQGVTRRAEVLEAAKRLRASGGRLVGVVINRAPAGQADGYGYAATSGAGKRSAPTQGRRARR